MFFYFYFDGGFHDDNEAKRRWHKKKRKKRQMVGEDGRERVLWKGVGLVLPSFMTHSSKGLEVEINEGGEKYRAGIGGATAGS